jgi:Periplasmic copper-binding protein (NosD)
MSAAARAATRVVAMTFAIDGRPVGTDTTRPYAVDLDASAMPRGRGRMQAQAVDRLGRRVWSAAAPVRIGAGARPARRVQSQPALDQVVPMLRRGHISVRLGPGRYRVNGVTLGSGARLQGAGARTVLEPPPGAAYDALLVASGRRIRVERLRLDGGGPGAGEGRAIEVRPGSRDVRLSHLAIERVRGDGVYAWGTHTGTSVQDSRIDGGGSGHAGVFVADTFERRDAREPSVVRNRIRGFRSYGIIFNHREHGDPDAALRAVALDNRVSDIRNPARDACVSDPLNAPLCGTEESGIWSGAASASIIGNTVVRARWDGIQTVGSSDAVSIVRNRVRRTRTGIYLEHSTNRSLIARNRISGVRTGINVEWTYGGVGSNRNVFRSNRIAGASVAGLFLDVGSDRNLVSGNRFVGGSRPAVVLQGASHNSVARNTGCGGLGPMVREQSGRWDDGSHAEPRGNRIVSNLERGACDTG